MEDKIVKPQAVKDESSFSFQQYLTLCLSKWKWFIISILFFCFIGGLYVITRQPEYARRMAVLIKDQDGGGSVGDISSAFSSMGLVSSNTNVNNELISLTSPAVIYEVVKRLGLDVNYETPGRFHEVTLYGTKLPYTVKFIDLEEQQGAEFTINIGTNGELTLDKFELETPDGKEKFDKTVKMVPGFQPVNTPVGKVIISPNGSYEAPKSKKAKAIDKIKVTRVGMQNSVEIYEHKLKGGLADSDADVIDLSMVDVSAQLASDFLNEILAVYNENWVEDKNKVAVATSKFIDERLNILEKELGAVDDEVYTYKSENRIPDLMGAAKMNLEQTGEMSDRILGITNQLAMVTYLRDYVTNPQNSDKVIPVNTGIGSVTLETQITAYNNLLLNRNSLAANSSESNPLVIEYDNQAKGLRESIVEAINAQITSFRTSLKNMEKAKGISEKELADAPTQAKYILGVERQQTVKQSLYLYLLQKREENELTQKFTADSTRVITPPTGSLIPVAPKKKVIMGVMFLLGFFLPAVYLYIKGMTDSRIRSKRDIEGIKAPFAGEIPFIGKKTFRERFAWILPAKKKSSRELEKVLSVVKEGSRDGVSESFRIVRGNIDFMNRNKGTSNVIMFTSFNAGSGKSFIAYNLGTSFALKNKRVLLVDGDLRHGSISQFVNMPSKGLTNYLTGATDDWQKLIVPVKDHENLYVMPIGHRPPNPAELIENGRFGTFIEAVRKDYDYILIDCPPVDVVVDTRLISEYADRTIFVVRAGLFDRKMLPDLDEIYKSGTFKQMCVVLNGTEGAGRTKSYGSYGYYGND